MFFPRFFQMTCTRNLFCFKYQTLNSSILFISIIITGGAYNTGMRCGYNTELRCGYNTRYSNHFCAGMTFIRPITRFFLNPTKVDSWRKDQVHQFLIPSDMIFLIWHAHWNRLGEKSPKTHCPIMSPNYYTNNLKRSERLRRSERSTNDLVWFTNYQTES